ncbi:MAG: calcium-translocating P-type ATPase, PMCA-type [Candidatus Aenigmarchaeota archaeon ex4484_56]|nr:MAG: calcium-translocating P-type ATPase, PMCA-type [Candidatus Aenigmarchaeota archaeon ex4484_56]
MERSNILKGLTGKEAEERLRKYGKNEIKKEKKVSPIKLFISQFISPIILLLIVAAVLSFSVNFLKHETYFDSLLILVIVFAAGIAGFVQDYKAERAIEALQRMASPKAKVIRDGKEQEIDSTDIVPDDLIVVESGDIIPADAVIVEGKLEIDESVLTGESKSITKKNKDRIYSNCSVYTGRCIAKVFATGMKTEIGKIASKMQEIKEEETQFQSHMKKFTKKIVGLTTLIIVITFCIGFNKFGILEAGLIAVSLAVAAIPEDLPAVITIALSLGAKNMVRRNALVRRLAITESVGCVDIICTDKTGTLTEGRMKVRDIWLIKENKESKNLAIDCCLYCNNAKQILDGKKKKWIGDETEIALKQLSNKKITSSRIDEISFSSKRKMMSVVYKIDNKKIIYSKGAPEVIIDKCSKALVGNRIVKLNEKLKRDILKKNEEFASKGYRILGLAYKNYEKEIEKNLIFIGLVVLSDLPRPEVKNAVRECRSAGIRIIMITGDNPLTARAVAEEVGIKSEGVVTGDELDKLNDDELKNILKKGINIFARTDPFHKLRILEILKKENHTVAMTGDGVNDALALKKADVGIAMGIRGTEVSKEASDIILLDDNFATIKNAVKEGRRIFDNIRKFVNYLFSCNIAEVLVILFATLFPPIVRNHSAILLYPVQILWINLITDGLPALALSIDPARPDIMRRKPRKKEEGIINKKLALLTGSIGVELSLIILSIFFIILPMGIDKARTALFTGFIIYEIVRIAVIRYNEQLIRLKDWLANRYLIYSIILSLCLQLVLIYSPLSTYFKIVPLGIYEWCVLITGSLILFIFGVVTSKIINKISK